MEKDRHICLNEGTQVSGLNQTQSSPKGINKLEVGVLEEFWENVGVM